MEVLNVPISFNNSFCYECFFWNYCAICISM